ncbi:MAG: Rieske (2Fe-2S) protein [Acidimicrobiales bacterium]
MRIDVGTLDELKDRGFLTTKAGSQPVCVFWHEGRAYAIDDRCPHLGFPLHRGTVEGGLVTCHWHHARFDLGSGGTLDPFADDARAYPVEIDGEQVVVVVESRAPDTGALFARLDEGLEQGLTLVVAKAVLGLLEAGVATSAVVAAGVDFGCRFREEGWGSGLTVLTSMANVLCHLDQGDWALALVQGLAFVSRDTRGHPPRFPLAPLVGGGHSASRLEQWYRRFVETRSGDAAERALASAVAARLSLDELSKIMTAAVTDHVFLDEGHTLDFTNKAFEVLSHLGPEATSQVLTTLPHQTAGARRHEEEGAWRHPHDLAGLAVDAAARLPEALARAGRTGTEIDRDEASAAFEAGGGPVQLAWTILGDDPAVIVDSVLTAIEEGATPEQLGRAVALAAALRITRFHTQNDHGDWDVVHHGFTTANALHQALVRAPSPLVLRGVFQVALKVFLDRFLNVPAARLPTASSGDLDALSGCWDGEGHVDEAGAIVYGYLSGGGDLEVVVAVLGRALLDEDAGFHWFQTYEAAARQALAWPRGSDEAALILAGTARFLAAHTPTRRELPQVVRIATRLRRGEALYEEDGSEPPPPPTTGLIAGEQGQQPSR